jgi:endonuclease III
MWCWACYGVNEGIVVDTHVARLAHRLGVSKAISPEDIEADFDETGPAR